jgi:hypothetical protein
VIEIARPPRNADYYAASAAPPSPPAWDLSHVSSEDVLSTLNPLQYLPVVGTIYRLVTGHQTPVPLQIGVAAAGALLFANPIGLVGTMIIAVAGEVARSAGPGRPHPAHVARLYAHASRFE